MAGEIVHIELPSSDFGRSAEFYGKLFGWKTDGAQSGGHLSFELPGGVRGSWIRSALAQATGPVPFVAVADVDRALAEAVRNGGRILVKRMQLGNQGACGLLADFDGNVVGVLATKAGATAPAVSETAAAGSGSGQSASAKIDGKAKAPPKASDKGSAKPKSENKSDVRKPAAPRKR